MMMTAPFMALATNENSAITTSTESILRQSEHHLLDPPADTLRCGPTDPRSSMV